MFGMFLINVQKQSKFTDEALSGQVRKKTGVIKKIRDFSIKIPVDETKLLWHQFVKKQRQNHKTNPVGKNDINAKEFEDFIEEEIENFMKEDKRVQDKFL